MSNPDDMVDEINGVTNNGVTNNGVNDGVNNGVNGGAGGAMVAYNDNGNDRISDHSNNSNSKLFLERRLAWVVGYDAMTVATAAAGATITPPSLSLSRLSLILLSLLL